MNKLDLRKDGKLSIENAKKITLIQNEVRREYNDFVESLVSDNKVVDLQWLMQITCRNTYVSWIYDSMCRLALLECLLQEGRKISCVYIDRPSLKTPVAQLLERYKSETQVYVTDIKRKKNFQLTRNLGKNLYVCFNLWLWSSLIKVKNKPKGKVFFLDTFLLNNSFDKSYQLQDRYYPGLMSFLPNEMKEKVWYLSTLSGLKYPWEWVSMFYRASKSKNNIILKECWLKPKDYFFAIWKSITLARTINKIPDWRGLDMSDLAKDEIIHDQGGNSITQAILMYLSFKRYKKAGIDIIAVVDWFENQVIDRGLYLGMRRYFPNVYIKGYLGFVPEDYYLGIFPTDYENKAHLIPNELLVVGGAYINKMKQFCPNLKVSSAPAFRFKDVFDFQQKDNNIRNVILLALPMKADEIKRIMEIVTKVKLKKSYKWIIKPHPTSSNKDIKKLIPSSLNGVYEFSELPVTEIFRETQLLITTASSTALEAVACGIHVAIVGNRSGPTINRLFGLVDESCWSICYTLEDLEHAILHQPIEQKIDTNKYFHPITAGNTMEMMAFDS